MRVGLLQCGSLPPDIVAVVGEYPSLFSNLLSGHEITIEAFDVVTGPPPTSPDACAGWLVSGSAASTYDPLPWIAPVEGFLRRVVDAEVPVVGICFGHQLLAQALGGRVALAESGWGAGVQRYELVGDRPDWMTGAENGSVRLVASHRDQVVDLPDGALVLARSDHCQVAAYTVGESVLAIQPHPEYSTDISRRLSNGRRDLMGDDVVDAALASLDQPIDDDLVGRWMASFLHQRA